MENKNELNIFFEAVKAGYRFALLLSIIICLAIGSIVYAITSNLSGEDITIQASQEDNTNSKQEVINGKTNS